MYWLNFWHLLIRFHMSLGYMISSKHHISHSLRTTDLLSKIHRLTCRCLILKTDLHMTLLDSCSLMIMLCCMWEDQLSYPTIISIHQHKTCRWLVISCNCWIDITCLRHEPLLCRQWICRWVCIRHLERWHLKISSNRPHSSCHRILRHLSHWWD